MNKIDALKHLEELKSSCELFESIETKKEDVEALDIAIKALKETAQEVPVQEQPVKVKIKISNISDLNNLIDQINNKLKKLKSFQIKVEPEE